MEKYDEHMKKWNGLSSWYGIGKAVAKQLLETNINTIIVSQNQNKLHQAQDVSLK